MLTTASTANQIKKSAIAPKNTVPKTTDLVLIDVNASHPDLYLSMP